MGGTRIPPSPPVSVVTVYGSYRIVTGTFKSISVSEVYPCPTHVTL